MTGWLAIPREWIASFGDIVKFCGRVVGEVFGLRVFRFFGEALRQASERAGDGSRPTTQNAFKQVLLRRAVLRTLQTATA